MLEDYEACVHPNISSDSSMSQDIVSTAMLTFTQLLRSVEKVTADSYRTISGCTEKNKNQSLHGYYNDI